ncbi:MAG TPA: M1 family metallopeptidase, partial [Thermoanaerobaculia bacterium]|nr:M1 family metallopeptidase [Thermoanaerobaculia bacterium]
MNRRLFFVAALLLVSSSVTAAQLRLGRDVVPLSQGIALRLDPRLERYAGITTILLDVKKSAPSFSLHAEGMNIESVAIDGVVATFAAGPEQTLVITPAAPLAAGQATLRISFDNDYDRTAVGLYKMTSGDEPYVFTQFQAIDARKAFPCFDEPSFKIPYQLTAVIPAQYDALFNTPVEKESADNEWKTIRFATTRPLPSYLLAMAVGTFEYTDVTGASVPMRIITTRGKGALTGVAAQSTPKLLAALETYFGSRYPFEKLDLIAVPEYWPGAMENPGLITFSEEILLLDPKAATPAQRRTNARITAHELAHMWFGDLVTMAWWDDLWLNESFGDWMGDRITQQVFPELGVEMNELQNVQNIMNVDASPLTNPIRDRNATPGSALSNVGIAYNKGKAVIRMFERWLGPERFQAGIRRHLQRHAWSNATASDFWSSLGTEVATPMETFIDQAGVPLVQVELVPPNRVRLTQSRYLRHGVTAAAQRWIVPVALRYSDGKSLRTQTVLLDAAAKTFTLDAKKVAWVFPHADAAGYYRWRVPPAAFVTLASHA